MGLSNTQKNQRIRSVIGLMLITGVILGIVFIAIIFEIPTVQVSHTRYLENHSIEASCVAVHPAHTGDCFNLPTKYTILWVK